MPGAAIVWSLRTSVDAILMFRFSAAGLGALRDLGVPFLLLVAGVVLAVVVPLPTPFSSLGFLLLAAAAAATAYRTAPVDAKRAAREVITGRLTMLRRLQRRSAN